MDVKAITRHELMSVEEIIMIMNEILKRDLGEKEYKKMEDKKVKKVRCKWSDGTLQLEKIYTVINDAMNGYAIKGDDNGVHIYARDMFEQVEEKKEHTVMELLDFPVGTKFDAKLEPRALNTVIEVAKKDRTKVLICKDIDEEDNTIELSEIWAKGVYTKVEEPKPVSFLEAWKALEEGKTIKSEETGYKYKKYNKNYLIRELEGKERLHTKSLTVLEISNQWIIE